MLGNKLSGFGADNLNRFSPDHYDALYAQFDMYKRELARICADIVALDPVNELVELGSGSGLFAKDLIDSFNPKNRVVVDEAGAEHVTSARHRIEKSSLNKITHMSVYCARRHS